MILMMIISGNEAERVNQFDMLEKQDKETPQSCHITLCCYPNVNGSVRNLSVNTSTAPIFLQFNYFRGLADIELMKI